MKVKNADYFHRRDIACLQVLDENISFICSLTGLSRKDCGRHDYFNRFSFGFFPLFFSWLQKFFQILSLHVW